MAETEGTTLIDEGSDSSIPESEGTALTPEVRDNQTIESLLGGTEAADEEADDDDGDPDADEEGADSESDDDAEDDPEITDEDIDTILDALDERLLTHPRVKKILDERAKAEADRRITEQRKSQSASQETERLIGQGRTAVEKLYNVVGKAGEQLAKAAKGEDFENVVIDPDEFKDGLRDYGVAVSLSARREFDDAFSTAFSEATAGTKLSPEESQAVVEIVQTANRIENDPKQGSQAAKNHLFTETVKFLVNRAKEEGKAEGRAEVTKKRTAIQKLVGDKGENATTAAMAKIARQRAKLPPKGTKPEPVSSGGATMEAYRAAKAAGDHAKADAIAARMSTNKAQGRA